VHTYHLITLAPKRVAAVLAPPAVPFIFGLPRVIFGVNDGEFALRQRYESCTVGISQGRSLGGFEVAAGFVVCDDVQFPFAALFMVADNERAT